MPRNLLFYVAVLLIFGTGIWLILGQGAQLEPAAAASVAASPAPVAGHGTEQTGIDALAANFRHPLALLLFQVLVIVVAARSLGMLFKKMGQPSVIGEMLAGILLGPSLLG